MADERRKSKAVLVRISKELHRDFKIFCAKQDMSMNEAAELLMRDAVHRGLSFSRIKNRIEKRVAG